MKHIIGSITLMGKNEMLQNSFWIYNNHASSIDRCVFQQEMCKITSESTISWLKCTSENYKKVVQVKYKTYANIRLQKGL